MATTGGAWDNAKKWCERCASEGEPVGVKGEGRTFVNFGVKKARDFPELYREHGIEAFVRDPSLIPLYNTPEGLVRLQNEMAELYHKRREWDPGRDGGAVPLAP